MSPQRSAGFLLVVLQAVALGYGFRTWSFSAVVLGAGLIGWLSRVRLASPQAALRWPLVLAVLYVVQRTVVPQGLVCGSPESSFSGRLADRRVFARVPSGAILHPPRRGSAAFLPADSRDGGHDLHRRRSSPGAGTRSLPSVLAGTDLLVGRLFCDVPAPQRGIPGPTFRRPRRAAWHGSPGHGRDGLVHCQQSVLARAFRSRRSCSG